MGRRAVSGVPRGAGREGSLRVHLSSAQGWGWGSASSAKHRRTKYCWGIGRKGQNSLPGQGAGLGELGEGAAASTVH